MDIKWIFFDVGSTLVDETVAQDHRVREMLKGKDITFSRFDSKRIELARLGLDGNSEAIKFFGLQKTPWHSEDEFLYEDAKATLDVLKGRGYRLGIIANQAPGTKERLEVRGLGEYFQVVAASAELGVAKPDKAIFKRAFSMAKCSPEEAAMVGDRLDNDIIPAKVLGMTTVWIKQGLAVHQSDTLGEGIADHIVDKLSSLCKIFI